MSISLEKLTELLSEGEASQIQWLNEAVRRIREGQTPPDPHRIIDEMLNARIITPLQSQFLLEGRNLLMANYVFCEKIGEGGMGTVYSARHRHMGRMVALKIIRPDRFKVEGTIDRFQREIRLASKLHHTNVVTSYDAGEFEGSLYLVMELVTGIDLKRRIQSSGVMTIPAALDVIRQTAVGLAYLHSQKLVHRDIKPSNLMLDRQGVVKILDLGLSRMVEWSDAVQADVCYDITGTGIVTGSVDFMPPEQFVNARSVDARADIYSLGCTLYWLLTGKPPFPGTSIGEIVVAHREHAIPRLSDSVKDVPPALESLLVRMLSKDPRTRLVDAQSVIEGIDALEILNLSDSDRRYPARRLLASDETQTMISEEVNLNSQLASRSSTHSAKSRETVAESVLNEPRRHPWLLGSTLVLGLLVIGLLARNFLTEETSANATGKKVAGAGVLDKNPGSGSGQGQSGLEGVSTAASLPQGSTWPADAPPFAIAPFDQAQAKAHQAAWAAFLGVPVEFTNSLGMSFCLIPPGEFLMGGTPEEIEEWRLVWPADTEERLAVARSAGPQHRVVLSRPFYLGMHEVTQQQFEQLLERNPSTFPAQSIIPDGTGSLFQKLPVETVNWVDATEFCRRLTEHEAGESHSYRLPTEAEWEFVCRAGTTTRTWLSDAEAAEVLGPNFVLASTQPVGSLSPNPFGVHDMLGNVWEWVEDWWDPYYYQRLSPNPAINPLGPAKGTMKCLRGGSWGQDLTRLRSANRYCESPESRNAGFGFRVALPIDAKR